MNNSWIKHVTIVLMIFLWSCKNHTENKNTDAANPVFQSDANLKKITDAINSSPKDAALYYERGEMLHKMQQDTLALKDLKAAAKLDSTKAEYQSAVGDLLFEDKDITGSVEWLRKAIALNPGDKKTHLKIAKLFLYIKKYPEGFEEINKALRADAFDPEGYFLKGMIYKELKDTAKAISTFLTAVEVSPDYRDAVIQLGLLYSAKKDSVALKYFDKALRIDSADVFPWFAKGVFYQQNKNLKMAEEEYKACVLRDRHYANAYFNMGSLYMDEDSIKKAWRQYDIVTKIDPGNPTAYYDRGLCSEMMDSIKNAIEDYRLASALDSTYKSPKDALARLRGKTKVKN